MLISALEQLTADAPTWLAKVYISRCFTKVFTLCNDPLHQVCFIGVCVSGFTSEYNNSYICMFRKKGSSPMIS